MRIFVDDELDAAYRQDGYVVVRLMESEQAAEIDAAARRHLPRDLPPHENVTFISYGQPELQWIDDLVGRAVDEALVPLLDDMRRFHPSLIVKPAGERPVPPHVHPIFTLEQAASTVFCWCALEDTDESNGAIQVLPGSHKLFEIMPMYGQVPYFLPCFDQIAERMETLNLRAGEAVLFDESLIHGSVANPSARNRIALATHCIKRKLQPITLFREGNGQYRVCDTGMDFGYQYHTRQEELDPSGLWPTLGFVDDVHRLVEADEFFERLTSGERISLTYPLMPRREPLQEAPRRAGLLARARDALRQRVLARA
jgi:phytanoyl-CoA dioxygenase PhyH